MVHSHIGVLEHRRQLKLIGRYFVMTCSNRNTKLHALNFQLIHKIHHPGRDSTEVVIVQLLTFCRRMSQHCLTCKYKTWSGLIQSAVYQEILLLPTQSWYYLSYILIKVGSADIGSSNINRMHSTQ